MIKSIPLDAKHAKIPDTDPQSTEANRIQLEDPLSHSTPCRASLLAQCRTLESACTLQDISHLGGQDPGKKAPEDTCKKKICSRDHPELRRAQDEVGAKHGFEVPEVIMADLTARLGYEGQTIKNYFRDHRRRLLKVLREEKVSENALDFSEILGRKYASELLAGDVDVSGI